VIKDYGIWYKVSYFTTNNHGFNNVLCYTLSKFLREKGIA
jgi:hypothetical protein